MPVEDNLYDDEKLATIRKDQEDPLVMYFVVRKELDMTPGKLAAQCSHAAQMIVIRWYELMYKPLILKDPKEGINEQGLKQAGKELLMAAWLRESFRKVVLKASDKEFEKIKVELDCFVVKDAGLTQVDPGSETCLVLWPIKKSTRPKIIKRLQVL